MAIKRKKTTDLKRQLWLTIKLTVPTIFILIICLLVALEYTEKSEIKIKEAIAVLDKSIQTESDMVSAFIKYAGTYRSGNIRLATRKIKRDHDKNIADIRKSIPYIERTSLDMLHIVYVLIGAIILQVFYLVFAVFRATNKIYGPSIVMERLLKDAFRGIKPDKESLRKGDELKSLFRDIYKVCDMIAPIVQRRLKREAKKAKSGGD